MKRRISSFPIILHIPHSSKAIPRKIRETFLLSDDELNKELICMTDAYTDELFTKGMRNTHTEVYPVSRLVVDPERFIDDNKEPMSERGMGVVYTLTSGGKKLKDSISKRERDKLINAYYNPHHDKVNLIAERQIKSHGKCLIVDCHSFPSIPLPYEFDQSKVRPDICIGVDNFHTPTWLSNNTVKLFQGLGYSTKINQPFSGCFVPSWSYHISKNVLSVMIEINRNLYMDEKTGEKNNGFKVLQGQLTKVIKEIRKREPISFF